MSSLSLCTLMDFGAETQSGKKGGGEVGGESEEGVKQKEGGSEGGGVLRMRARGRVEEDLSMS